MSDCGWHDQYWLGPVGHLVPSGFKVCGSLDLIDRTITW